MNRKNIPVLSRTDFDAVIFDLDGVVTRTAEVHARAWKKMFDEYLAARSENTGESFNPFDIDTDYREYVDGKPRVDGVRDFLAARNIVLPEGELNDPVDRQTVHGLGNRKNEAFRKTLQENGVEVYPSTVHLIRELRSRGFQTAIISSSKNCREILEQADILDLFDQRVDGLTSLEIGIPGKPAPDIFLEAAQRLRVVPERAAVVEDAISGVQAGQAGGFGLVLGLDRTGNPEDLRENGADVVVSDLAEVTIESIDVPSALEQFQEIESRIGHRQLAVFLDYDGTLTPIVDTPDLAVLSDTMRRMVTELSLRYPVGIISGRDLRDVQKLVSIDSLIYAGSHGFEISGPEGFRVSGRIGDEFLPLLDQAQQELQQRLNDIPKCLVERKQFAIAIHYRLVDESRISEIEEAVDSVHARIPRLRKALGKKIFELQPDIDWHKGRALESLLRSLDLAGDEVCPVYLGDDVTDEDAFRYLTGRGIGIVVRDQSYPTTASYCLQDPDQVAQFLKKFLEK